MKAFDEQRASFLKILLIYEVLLNLNLAVLLQTKWLPSENILIFFLKAAWLLRAVTCIDLTTLSGDDTPSNVSRLCYKAKHPIREDLLQAMNMHDKGIVGHLGM